MGSVRCDATHGRCSWPVGCLLQVYRAAQHEIALLALEAVGRQAGSLLSAVSGPGTVDSPRDRQPGGISSNGGISQSVQLDTPSANMHAAGLQGQSPLMLRERAPHSGCWRGGLEVTQAVPAGQELACIPLHSGLAAASQTDLAVALALAAVEWSAGEEAAVGRVERADGELLSNSSSAADMQLCHLGSLHHPLSQHALPGSSREALLEGLAGDAHYRVCLSRFPDSASCQSSDPSVTICAGNLLDIEWI